MSIADNAPNSAALQHAKMALFVTRARGGGLTRPGGTISCKPPFRTDSSQGQQAFLQRCAACHAVRGLQAGGILGPNLSHFGGRTTIGAGALKNDPDNLAFWINNTQIVKPGSKMPDLDVPAAQASAITTFLEGLK